jgi:hypothetical protein
MEHQSLVNDCINVLHEKNIEPVHRLRLEVQLCKLKQLLLQRDLDSATGDHFTVSLLAISHNLASFEGEVCSASFEEVNRELQRIADVVAGWAEPR